MIWEYVKSHESVVQLKDGLKFIATVLHSDDSPALAEVLAQFCLVSVARVQSDLLLNPTLQLDHVFLKHLLIRHLQWYTLLHAHSDVTIAV